MHTGRTFRTVLGPTVCGSRRCMRPPSPFQARADEGTYDDMVRVDYTTSISGRPGSTTLSMSHIMHLLTEPTAASMAGLAATAAERECRQHALL